VRDETTGAAPRGARQPIVLATWLRWGGTVLAALAVLAGTLGLTGVVVVRRHLLDPSTYQDALVRADVYNRVYTDVLADPQLSETKEQLLGKLQLASLDPASARVAATNTLRWAVPPSTIREGTDALVDAVIRYLRGDTDRIAVSVDLTSVLSHLDDVIAADARAAVAVAHPIVMRTIPQYRSAVAAFLDEVARGRIPSQIPIPSSTLAGSQVSGVLERLAGTKTADTLRMTIDAGVLADDDRDALAAAMQPSLTRYSARAVSALRDRLGNGHTFDVISALTHHTGQRSQEIVRHLNTVRDVTTRWTAVLLAISAALLVAGIAGLLVLHRGSPRAAGLILAGVLCCAGVATFATWSALRHLIEPPLHPAISTGPGTWNLPAGLRDVIRDVARNLVSGLNAAILRIAVVPVLVGVVLAIGLSLKPLFARPKRLVALTLVAGTLAAVAVATVLVLRSTGRARTCNGHAELCGRRYNDVVQAATHNSMSSPDVVQFWPEQDSTIREQLDAGITTLLIDTHYWTAVDSADQLSALVPGIPKTLAKLTIATNHERLQARDGVYLCHVHCVFGGQPVLDGLEQIRSFLDANPDTVVTLIVQDEVTPADTVSAFTRAGLTRYLYTGKPGGSWLTFGEMIKRSERLVVFAENHGSQPQWLRPAFATIQDTPFGFPTVAAMSCTPNRGPASAPLFLINHWISNEAPDRSTAAIVNARDFIIQRAHECTAQRRRLPTFIAVDFSTIGDVTGAVDELNHLAR
jgi:hypothetical protein